jgi:4-hydroxybenzoate polyprenyltransferase
MANSEFSAIPMCDNSDFDSKMIPLAVDLDGTLIKVDTLHECLAGCLRRRPLFWLEFCRVMGRSKAGFKRALADRVEFDPSLLPYNDELVEYVRRERRAGRRIGLFTAADQSIADKIGEYLGLFDVVRGSDGSINLSGRAKAEAIQQEFGERFAYAGNGRADRPIFEIAERVILVGSADRVKANLETIGAIERTFASEPADWLAWTHALRLHHWIKNVLVFVAPVLGFRAATTEIAAQSVLLFVLMCVLASATYLINDVMDLVADRQHPQKRSRPIAAGVIPVANGIVVAAVLIVASLGLALLLLPWPCLAVLASYLAFTLGYSLVLKHQPIVDIVTLAWLFTLRVLAGALLLPTPPSPWLLTFSMLFFLGLATIKRYAELHRVATPGANIGVRGYTAQDLGLLLAAGVASSFAAIVIFTIYLIDEQYPNDLYRNPHALWGVIPVLLIWTLRYWHLTVHGRMSEDPVVFAVRDRFSLASALVAAAVLFMAW